MLEQYTRNKINFKDLKSKVKFYRTKDLYDEFVNLGNYFNARLVVELENILNTSLTTTPNKFMINVGDGNINWIDIVDIIPDDSISLSKLQKVTPNSVLCTDSTGKIIPIFSNIDYGILFARYQNTHIWRKLVNEDIEDNSITGIKIGRLEQINIDENTFNNFIVNDILETKHILDNEIDGSKIGINNLELDSLYVETGNVNTGFIPQRYVDNIGVNNPLAFVSECITPIKILDNSIDVNVNFNIFELREYSNDNMYLYSMDNYEYPVNNTLNKPEILESYNILPECLIDDHLIPYENIGDINNIPWYDNPQEARYFQKGYIAPQDDCRVEGRCIPLGQLRLRHFDDVVRAALMAKGVTDDD